MAYKYIEQINNYKPTNEEEVADKALFLKYFDTFENVLTRENEMCHLTSSAFIVNKTKDKVLSIYHKIYNSWGWVGGHADGDDDMLYVALKEAREETSIKNLKPLSENIISIDIMPVLRHYRKGKFVSSHVHLSVAYLMEGDENDKIEIQEEENSGVAWLTFEELVTKCTEPHMIPIYKRIINKLQNNQY